ncbi:MAG: HAD-IC family P-type ATPase [Pseudomonadota bacterium]|nr:HAD-IC family P-type ATPase [Pseudomonadota bacterium]
MASTGSESNAPTHDEFRPDHPGVVTLSATVPGRVRLRVRGLLANAALKTTLENKLAAHPQIHRVQVRTRTGNILVEFDPGLGWSEVTHMVARFAGLDGPTTDLPAASMAPENTTEDRPRSQTQSIMPMGSDTDSPDPSPSQWYAWPLDQVVVRLGTDEQMGLSDSEAANRLARYGPNRLGEAKARSSVSMLAEQFTSLPVGMLAASAVISLATGGRLDAAVILGVVAINGGIGYFTEQQAEKTINALKEVAPKNARVRREGRRRSVPVEDLVSGDVVELGPGDHVPADLRLVSSERLVVDESPLTGESVPTFKSITALPLDTALAERANMAYMGTMVTGGSGTGVVAATGAVTELGKIQAMVGRAHAPETPMQRQLDVMGSQLGFMSAAVCGGVFAIGLMRGYGLLDMLKMSISLAVAAIPEGLTAVATTSLALGIRKMRAEQVAIRHINAVETLGAVQVFCLDKTGTLTLNRMTVCAVHLTDKTLSREDDALTDGRGRYSRQQSWALDRLLTVGVLCSDTDLQDSPDGPKLHGSPTENALVQLALDSGVDVAALQRRHPRIQSQYRSEGRPYMVTVHDSDEGPRWIALKGRPAEVLDMCSHAARGGELIPLDDERRAAIVAGNETLAGDGLRVLGLAWGEAPSNEDPPSSPKDLVWLGMVGMADPLRPGMAELMDVFHGAGIRTVMITGDQSATAYAIGRQVHIADDRPVQILDSSNLDRLDPDVLAGLVKKTDVFARVSPAHKLRIVQALQDAGQIVAMTGDGINDGPALKAADVGVAMGANGTDVARSVADVVLEDDNLETMTVAVAQGRTIYQNIRKTLRFLLSTNFSEIEVMLAGVTLGIGQPLNPMQLLWINLFTDIFPALALSMESPEPDVLLQAPRDPEEPIIRRSDLLETAGQSAFITVGALGAYLYGLRRYGPGAGASTQAFDTITVAQLLQSLSCRSEHYGLFVPGDRPRNPYLDWAVGGTLAVQVLSGWVPGLRRLLGTAPRSLGDYFVVAACAGGPLLINESVKRWRAMDHPVGIGSASATTPTSEQLT